MITIVSLIDRWPWNGCEGERLERFGDTRIGNHLDARNAQNR